MRSPPASARAAAGLAVAGAAAFLLARLAGDVKAKPLFEDEAVAGLIAARPAAEIVATVLWDRGGAPLHFLLAHAAFSVEASAETLRWVSVIFAVAAVAATYDLGRRLGGTVAGVAAALVTAGSGMLAVYGTFGRMYALLAFASALAASLFVRALDVRTVPAALAAVAAAWLLPAIHPYGGLVVAIEALVALAVWRGRPLRPAVPVAAAALAFVPFAVADARLATRFSVGPAAERRLASAGDAWEQLSGAVRGFAGGGGVTLAVFLILATVGIALAARRRPAFAAFALVSLLAPPLLAALVPTGRAPDLSPRHLVFALPFWAAFVGLAVERGVRGRSGALAVAALVAVAVLVAVSPQGIHDPRSITYTASLGTPAALAEPSAWLQGRVGEGDVLYPYSSVYLAALPESGRATTLPRAQARPILDALERADLPARALYVAVPLGTAGVDLGELRRRLGPAVEARRFRSWLLLRAGGPLDRPVAVLAAADEALAAARAALTGAVPDPLAGYFELNSLVLCESLSTLGAECVTE